MSGLRIVTGPTVAPVSRIEARNHLRLDDDVDDAQVRSYIQAATDWAENYTNRFFISRSCQMMIDGAREIDSVLWEGTRTGFSGISYVDHIEIAGTPVMSVESVNYYTDDDTQNVWADSNYYVDTFSEPARIVLRDGGTYPTDLRVANGIEVNFTAGYGSDPRNVPEPIKLAILQYMTFLYEHRGDFERFPAPTPPSVLSQLLGPYKVMRFNSSPYDSKVRIGAVG